MYVYDSGHNTSYLMSICNYYYYTTILIYLNTPYSFDFIQFLYYVHIIISVSYMRGVYVFN